MGKTKKKPKQSQATTTGPNPVDLAVEQWRVFPHGEGGRPKRMAVKKRTKHVTAAALEMRAMIADLQSALKWVLDQGADPKTWPAEKRLRVKAYALLAGVTPEPWNQRAHR